eukprot:354979-Chlamydomonas_euryale.AAC.5
MQPSDNLTIYKPATAADQAGVTLIRQASHTSFHLNQSAPSCCHVVMTEAIASSHGPWAAA